MSEYNPQEIESKWQAYWEAERTFRVEDGGQNKLYVLDMFPYPSGSGLHIGHPLGYTATDIYSRFKRMRGFSVLHPMGYDAFGLPAEQHAISTGEHPSKITEENCQRFTEQMKQIGFSYDWQRELATCRPDYYKWTQWIFLKLYNSWFDDSQNKARPIAELPIPQDVQERGESAVLEYQADYRLAYMADSMVNWCPALGTVLANEEVIDGKSERGGHDVVRKPMLQWMLRITKYANRLLDDLEQLDWPENIKEQQRNWIGKRFGTEIKFGVAGSDATVDAFTTRPDTLFGVTYFVLSPEHSLVEQVTADAYREQVRAYCEKALAMSELARTIDNREKTGVFTGSYVVNPITQEQVPLYVGDYVLMSYGTGAVMGVPAHDERDFEFARKFQLEIRPVIAPTKGDDDLLQAIKDGECSWTGPGVMTPCSFTVAAELGLEGRSNEEGKQLISDWLEQNQLGRKVANYKLRDWLFSRQRYWGEPIPIIHWEDGSVTALTEADLPLLLPEVEDYLPGEGGESPLSKASEWLEVRDPDSGKRGRRETNTMPQWAGSCWYYLRFIDPSNPEVGWDAAKEQDWMPVDLYVGGAEHAVLHLLYARFWHKVLYDLGYVSTAEPFQKLFNQGMIVSNAYKDSRGALIPVDEVELNDQQEPVHIKTGEVLTEITAKMSKSLRNVINPDEVTSEYGADTLRMYLMFMGPLDATRMWDSQAIAGNFRFLKRMWNLVLGDESSESTGLTAMLSEQEDANVSKAVHRTVKKVTEDIDRLQFNTAIAAMMECLNEVSNKAITRESLEKLVLLVSPFAPHLGEELWSRLGHKQSLAYQKWPEYDQSILVEQSAAVVIQVNGKKRATIEVPIDIDEDNLKARVSQRMADTSYDVDKAVRFITVYQSGTKIPKLVNVIVK